MAYPVKRKSQFRHVGFLAGMTDDMLKSYAERVKVDTEMSKESREATLDVLRVEWRRRYPQEKKNLSGHKATL